MDGCYTADAVVTDEIGHEVIIMFIVVKRHPTTARNNIRVVKTAVARKAEVDGEVVRRTETAELQPSKLHVARQPFSVSTLSPCSKNMSPHCEPRPVCRQAQYVIFLALRFSLLVSEDRKIQRSTGHQRPPTTSPPIRHTHTTL